MHTSETETGSLAGHIAESAPSQTQQSLPLRLHGLASSLQRRRSTPAPFDPLHLHHRSLESHFLLHRLSGNPQMQQDHHRQRLLQLQHLLAQAQAQAAPEQTQGHQQQQGGPAPARPAQMATAAPAPAPAPAQVDDNCEAEARPWSPGSIDEYADMPSLINASPIAGTPFVWDPPALSPVRNFLAAPPQGSSDHPVQMDLDDSEGDDGMPALVNVADSAMLDWLAAPPSLAWDQLDQALLQPQHQAQQPRQQQGQRQQQQRQRERQRQAEDAEFAGRASGLSAFPHMRPPRATGPRSRPASRRTTGPQAARPAMTPAQQDAEDASARGRRHIDALYASAVQQVWARTARLSAGLLNWSPSDSPGAQLEQQPLLRPASMQQPGGQQQQQQEEQQEYVQLQQVLQVPLPVEQRRAPAACSFLRPGLAFVGSQKLLQHGSLRRDDQWTVRVVLHDVDYARGRVSGSMRALDVAGAPGPIDTFWEGHIIDDLHHSFWTQTWGAGRETDLRHWSKFPGFADIKPLVIKHAGRCGQLQHHHTIFMRWKEQFFVNPREECGLTIAGFYYIALDRATGAVRGLYHDPNSSPFQELSLQVDLSSGSSSSSSTPAGSNRSSDSGGQPAAGSAAGSLAGSSHSSSSSTGGVRFASYSFA